MKQDFERLFKKYPHRKWELVLFVSPVCNSSCAHCWSYNTYLGKMVDLDWYEHFLKQLNLNHIERIKLSGGETTLYPKLPELICLIRRFVPDRIPIDIFTNGRSLVPIERSADSVQEAMKRILKLIGKNKNICLQMSGDEHHAGSLWRSLNGISKPAITRDQIQQDNQNGLLSLKNMVLIFLESCQDISNKNKELNFSFKVKLHCEKGRLKFHRDELYADIPDAVWNACMVCSEGLIDSGNAKNLSDTIQLTPNDDWISFFVFPGASFSLKAGNEQSEIYLDENGISHYLSGNRSNDSGIVMMGWWNLVQKKYCAIKTSEFLNLLNDF